MVPRPGLGGDCRRGRAVRGGGGSHGALCLSAGEIPGLDRFPRGLGGSDLCGHGHGPDPQCGDPRGAL